MSTVGPYSVHVLSVDDKTKVPLTTATRQASVLMHMIYKIRIPDKDFVVAAPNKLTPSVHTAYEIARCSSKSDFNILCSEPMHIVIRSGKHLSSTAYMCW